MGREGKWKHGALVVLLRLQGYIYIYILRKIKGRSKRFKRPTGLGIFGRKDS